MDPETAAAAARLESALARHGVPAEFDRFSGPELTALDITPALSPELVSFYETRAPRNCELEFSPEQLRLYSPDELDERQRGYRAGDWQDPWLAIGDSSADPVIANTAEEGTPIALAIHGIGEWRARWVAPTLATFLGALSDWVVVLYGQFGGEMLDEDLDFDVKPGFVDAIRSVLAASLPEECVTAWIDYVTT